MKNNIYQIAIDGPGGAGKSTIAIEVARRLGFLFINTGGMYRCYAIALQHTDLKDLTEVQRVLDSNKVTLTPDKLYLNGQDVTKLCYTNKIAMLASTIGTIGIVRTKCVRDQQAIAAGQSCVMEGRDITTVVLPHATLKVFLTASVKTRAERRWIQSKKVQPLAVVVEDLKKRDYQDTHRTITPLIQAPDAIVINTDGLSFEQNVQQVLDAFNKKRPNA